VDHRKREAEARHEGLGGLRPFVLVHPEEDHIGVVVVDSLRLGQRDHARRTVLREKFHHDGMARQVRGVELLAAERPDVMELRQRAAEEGVRDGRRIRRRPAPEEDDDEDRPRSAGHGLLNTRSRSRSRRLWRRSPTVCVAEASGTRLESANSSPTHEQPESLGARHD